MPGDMSEERVGPKYSVLILDDEPSSRELCSELLGGLGFDTVEAASATRALAILEHSPVDIARLDRHGNHLLAGPQQG